MGYERTHSFQKKKKSFHTPQPTTQFASRPFDAPVQMKPKKQLTPDELEHVAFNQNKFEAFGLQLKEESGTITPLEQERLGVLQAKMNDFWAQRLERASRFGFDISKVSFTPREGQAAPQLQPMWRQGTQRVQLGGQHGGAVQRQIDRIATPTLIQRFATTYTPDADDAYTGGKGITARVGAKNKWPRGQIPVGGIPRIINDVGAIKNRYVAGHLMNEEIAGLADNANLTVLSVKSNNTHKGYESKLKYLGYRAEFIEPADVSLTRKYGDKAYEHGADYKVEVVASSPDGTQNFPQEQLLVSGLKVSITPIRIHKVTRLEEPWPEMQKYKVTDAIVPNVPPYPPASRRTSPTNVKLSKTTNKRDNINWGKYNEEKPPTITRSGRTSKRYQPY